MLKWDHIMIKGNHNMVKYYFLLYCISLFDHIVQNVTKMSTFEFFHKFVMQFCFLLFTKPWSYNFKLEGFSHMLAIWFVVILMRWFVGDDLSDGSRLIVNSTGSVLRLVTLIAWKYFRFKRISRALDLVKFGCKILKSMRGTKNEHVKISK